MHHGVRIQDAALVAAATLSNRYITDRFLPDKAIDLIDEAASRVRVQIDSMPEELDQLERKRMQLEIEREALKKERDARQRRSGSSGSSARSPSCRARPAALKARWENEKGGDREAARAQGEARGAHGRARARAAAGQPRARRRDPVRPAARAREAARGGAAEARRAPEGGLAALRGGHRRGDRRDRLEVDRHPGRQDDGGRAGEAPPDGGEPAPPRGRPGRGAARGVERGAPRARRPPGPEPADRLVHLPRPDGRREDRDGARARRVPVRRRAGDGAHRHERVHGEAHRLAADRRAARLRRLRGGRPAHRGRAPPALQRGALRRDREGAPGRVQRAAPDPRRRAPHRRPGPHRRLQERGPDHDLEHRQPVHRRARPGRSARSSRRA